MQCGARGVYIITDANTRHSLISLRTKAAFNVPCVTWILCHTLKLSTGSRSEGVEALVVPCWLHPPAPNANISAHPLFKDQWSYMVNKSVRKKGKLVCRRFPTVHIWESAMDSHAVLALSRVCHNILTSLDPSICRGMVIQPGFPSLRLHLVMTYAQILSTSNYR